MSENIAFEIIGFYRDDGSALVRFSKGKYSTTSRIGIPLIDGEFILGEQLNAHLLAFAPSDYFSRMEALETADSSMFPGLPDEYAALREANLPDFKEYARSEIDRAAGFARLRFISWAVGQDVTYLLKSQQAQEFKDAGYEGIVPLYIQEESLAVGCSPKELADTILANRDLWMATNAKIEAARVGGKKKFSALETKESVLDSMRETICFLQAIKP